LIPLGKEIAKESITPFQTTLVCPNGNASQREKRNLRSNEED
jgi:hypothetical protein